MGLFGPSRKEFQRVQEALALAQAEGQRLAQQLARAEAQQAALDEERRAEGKRRADAEAERDALYEERDVLRIERDMAAEERDGLRAERDALTGERDSLRAERDAALAEADDLRRRIESDRRAGATGESTAGAEAGSRGSADSGNLADPADRIGRGTDGSWALVLADLERRWAAGTGALPAMRGVTDGPVSAQLAEGLTREVERLREEMGVDVGLITGKPIEPADPVIFLLAATDLLGALAATCERVTVTVDDTLVLTGEVWVELGDDLDASRDRAVAAGALIDPIHVDDDQVRITLRP